MCILNCYLQEVYVKQPPEFENANMPNHVFKLNKALYGLMFAYVLIYLLK